jgi:hypothetical protein
MDIDAWLDELKIPRQAYRMVMLLPPIYVAWADGRIQPEERELILGIARDHGLLEEGGQELLNAGSAWRQPRRSSRQTSRS